MSLKSSAVLVSLQIKQWSARKLDRDATKELCQSKDAQIDSGRFNKLLIDPKHLKPINRIVNSTRNFHYANTLAWEHKGADILPSAMYFEYTPKIAEFKSTFYNMVDEFITDYPIMIEQRAKALGELFNVDDYPSGQDVRNKFFMDLDMTPISEASDFRIDLADEELDDLKDKLNSRLELANKAAEHELFARMYTMVAKVVVTLLDPGKVFRNTLILNPLELARKTPKMNINNNPDLNSLGIELRDKCTQVSIEGLRDQEQYSYRKLTAENFKKLLNDIESAYERSKS